MTVINDPKPRAWRAAPSAMDDVTRAGGYYAAVVIASLLVALAGLTLWVLLASDLALAAGVGGGLAVLVTGILRADRILTAWSDATIRQMEADAADARQQNATDRRVALLDAQARRADAVARLEQVRTTAYTRSLRIDGAQTPTAAPPAQIRDADSLIVPHIAAAPVTDEMLDLPGGYVLPLQTLMLVAAIWPCTRAAARDAIPGEFSNDDFKICRAILLGAGGPDKWDRVRVAKAGQWSALPHLRKALAATDETAP